MKRRKLAYSAQDSKLFDQHVQDIGIGRATPQDLQRTAKNVVHDVVNHGSEPVPVHLGMASLGSGGAHPQNIERDLETWHSMIRQARQVDLDVYNVGLTTMNPDGHGTIKTDWPIFLPHEIFAMLYEYDNAIWETCVTGPLGELATFWEHVREHDWFKASPASKLDPASLNKVAPVGLHGDEQKTKTKTKEQKTKYKNKSKKTKQKAKN